MDEQTQLRWNDDAARAQAWEAEQLAAGRPAGEVMDTLIVWSMVRVLAETRPDLHAALAAHADQHIAAAARLGFTASGQRLMADVGLDAGEADALVRLVLTA